MTSDGAVVSDHHHLLMSSLIFRKLSEQGRFMGFLIFRKLPEEGRFMGFLILSKVPEQGFTLFRVEVSRPFVRFGS